MKTHIDDNEHANKGPVGVSNVSNSNRNESVFQFKNNRPEAKAHNRIQKIANDSGQVKQFNTSQPKAKNNTGLPNHFKDNLESLSGIDMSDVRVHRNSSKPAEVGSLAYAHGTEIHLGPGQEKHLGHEAWHTVQQKQGRVAPTFQFKSEIGINNDSALEREADVMGNKISQLQKEDQLSSKSPKVRRVGNKPTYQMMGFLKFLKGAAITTLKAPGRVVKRTLNLVKHVTVDLFQAVRQKYKNHNPAAVVPAAAVPLLDDIFAADPAFSIPGTKGQINTLRTSYNAITELGIGLHLMEHAANPNLPALFNAFSVDPNITGIPARAGALVASLGLPAPPAVVSLNAITASHAAFVLASNALPGGLEAIAPTPISIPAFTTHVTHLRGNFNPLALNTPAIHFPLPVPVAQPAALLTSQVALDTLIGQLNQISPSVPLAYSNPLALANIPNTLGRIVALRASLIAASGNILGKGVLTSDETATDLAIQRAIGDLTAAHAAFTAFQMAVPARRPPIATTGSVVPSAGTIAPLRTNLIAAQNHISDVTQLLVNPLPGGSMQETSPMWHWLWGLGAKTLDVTGLKEIVQIVSSGVGGLMSGSLRDMNVDERTLGEEVYGDSVHLSDAQIMEHSNWGGGMALTFANTIHGENGEAFTDPADAVHDTVKKGLLIHEMLHIAQEQKQGMLAWIELQWGRGASTEKNPHTQVGVYDYGQIAAGSQFRKFTREQQGAIVQDYSTFIEMHIKAGTFAALNALPAPPDMIHGRHGSGQYLDYKNMLIGLTQGKWYFPKQNEQWKETLG